jgi:hypothetical protein
MNLFYITSFITEKVSKKVIKAEELEKFKLVSNIRYKPYSKKYLYEDEIYEIKKPPRKNLLSNWKNIISGNKRVSEISGEGFHLYIPHANADFVRVALSHQKCKGFSFIEEGFTSYCRFESINEEGEFLRRVKNYVYYMGQMSENKIFKEGYSKAYCMSEYAFPKWENKKIVRPKIKESKEVSIGGEKSCILVVDSMKTISSVKKEIYISTLSRVVTILEKKYDIINYKLHPDNYIKKNDIIFKSIIEMCNACTREIDQERSIERLAVGSKSDVIVNLSSAGLYCLLFSDSKVYTFYDMFRRHAERAGLESENILGFERFVPDIFWENALPLEGGG